MKDNILACLLGKGIEAFLYGEVNPELREKYCELTDDFMIIFCATDEEKAEYLAKLESETDNSLLLNNMKSLILDCNLEQIIEA